MHMGMFHVIFIFYFFENLMSEVFSKKKKLCIFYLGEFHGRVNNNIMSSNFHPRMFYYKKRKKHK